MKRKEKQEARVVFFLCLLSIHMGDLGSESCRWEQHLATPGRTGYTTCDGPDTAEILWKISIAGETDTAPLVVENALLILKKDSCAHLNESSLMKIDVFTGEITGHVDSDWWDPYFDMFSDGINVYVVDDKEILKVDFDQQEPTAVTSVPEICLSYSYCHALILEDKVVYPTTPLVCFSRPDFTSLWSSDSLFSDHTEVKIRSVAADESHLYVISEWDSIEKLHAIHMDTGTVGWSHTLHNAWTITVDDSTVFAGGKDIIALDADTGRTLWRFSPEGKVFTNLVIGLEYIFAADSQDHLYALDKITGKMAWKTGWQGATGWAFLVGGGKFLYCASSLGEKSKLVCFHAEDGKKVWEYGFSSPIHAQPALAQGILIVALLRGEIYAFATNPVQESGNNTLTGTKQPESRPPEPSPTSPEQTTVPPASLQSTLPDQTTPIPISVFIIIGVAGVLIIYYLFRQKKLQNI